MVSAQFPDAQPGASGIAVRPLASFPSQAWRNGGGTTRALAEDAQGRWRISLADVERDGPYSRFPDMDRLSLIIRGAGVDLRHEGCTVALRPGCPIEYDGANEWQATLRDGPVVALNTMALRGHFLSNVVLLIEATLLPAGSFALVLPLDGRCTWRTADRATATMLQTDCLMTRDMNGPDVLLTPLAGSVPHAANAATAQNAFAALVQIEAAGSEQSSNSNRGEVR